MMLYPENIILRRLLSEKATDMLASQNRYVFDVNPKANKADIKNAVQKLFNVNVLEVRTVVQRGKIKRFGRFESKRANRKKAYVKLATGQNIAVFQGV